SPRCCSGTAQSSMKLTGLPSPLPVFCDISLRDYLEVVPAAGATNAAVRISPHVMAELTKAEWVDVCQ
ncbi:MAG: hypothetical protein J0G97_10725, partial [Rhizobium pusense]|nr:hypothetical protein [Agrobacterium pusense]